MSKEFYFYEKVIILNGELDNVLKMKPFEQIKGSYKRKNVMPFEWVLLIIAEKDEYLKDMRNSEEE